jgi:peptidoglycan/LPS O-acetylase OafA/YrhL
VKKELSPHVIALDSLRGLAALMVVLVHCLVCYQPALFTHLSQNLINAILLVVSGRAPVIVFFVLSGFVLAKASTGANRLPLRFYIKRLLRLLPAAYAGLLLGLLVNAFVTRINFHAPDSYLKYWIAVHYQAHLSDLPDSMLFKSNFINPVYWTLHVELIGSLLLPFVVALMAKNAVNRLGLFALSLSLPFVPFYFGNLGKMTNALIFSFIAGVLLQHLVTADRLNFRRARSGVIGLACVLLGHSIIGPTSPLGATLTSLDSLKTVLGPDNNLAIYFQHLVETFGAMMLIGHIAQCKQSIRWLHAKPAIQLGKISYSIYVMHFPVLALTVAYLEQRFSISSGYQTLFLPAITFVIVVGITLPLSYLSFHVFERPFIRLARQL